MCVRFLSRVKGIVVDVFRFPSGWSLKVLELDDSLYEVSLANAAN